MERTTNPFLTLPSSCTGEELTTTISTDSWQEPGALNPDGTPDLGDPRWKTASSSSSPLTGCESLHFNPRLTVSAAEPEAARAESPSGLSVELKLPQEENVNGVAGADLKEAEVTLPAGFAISPSAAGGREACTPAEIELDDAKAPTCPEASTSARRRSSTPLLEDPLEGSLYLAQPYENEPAFSSPEHPVGSLLALYLVAEGDGMLIKLAGEGRSGPGTGQLTVSWANLPQLPIGEMRAEPLRRRTGAARNPACVRLLRSPEQADAVERHARRGGVLDPRDRLGTERRRVPERAASAPSFTAGTLNNQAGASSAFSLTLSRQDGEQRFGAFSVTLPPGMSGILKNVAQCPEPQASKGECPQASEIGTTTVGVGPGGDQFYLPEQGRPANEVYLTGPLAPPEG